ncbi:hypothetical protein BZG36_01759 [Bifiguratus adelaidae]|uniref:CBS domain-containing protein n=1 Tax=Bifiguratus adelaidae TaxID=1938954 RepID=A0A261Y319_9FUNG|nr:hypothetical protein BZG36_01759 [Bifiguratus adelaidae]
MSVTPQQDVPFPHWEAELDSPSLQGNMATDISRDRPSKDAVQRLMKTFLKENSSYDVLPVSYRLIVLDTKLLVKKALAVMMQNGVVSAPLWDAEAHHFAGMLTVSDFINLIQYYYTHSSVESALQDIDTFQIQHMRMVEKTIGAPPRQLLSIHPMSTLYDACKLLVESRSHRIPLIDRDSATGQELIASVLTQHRILRFIAMNFKHTRCLVQPLSELRIGIYENLATAKLSTPVIQVINMFVERKISSVPIVDDRGAVLNVYETVDVMSIARSQKYHELDIPVGQALQARPADYPGVHTCTLNDTLASIFAIIRKRKVYRLIVIDGDNKLKGIVSLSDILR